ncbi:T9SS type A sorting domain-containing protein [Flavobacterium sp. MAH-1]|uniref:T9SS type A sorting domain-containing protein n=1 Tax=Flavobacterium agri TaxID=2743471 RepID=A0A7Y8Y2C0_9FLAO|nr:two-component regulator propeller domain-containing protein [Flavobacterium agri]NUY81285.1 T9SS type A sorting domain-containing protein [Flavobacterium agri]NYA71309.1 T9SS type A sorting domain-containing protein [Flavobacterium agri]
MKKNYIFIVAMLLASVFAFPQANPGWTGYFSYTEIKDLTQSPTRFYAASENALFSKDLTTNVIKTTNTIDGLSSQVISAVYHSAATNRTIVGYENGLINVINSDGTITKVVDIINKQLPPNIKRVNHFMESDGIIYISCDFGICQYNITNLQFGDTYYIGTGPSEIIIKQTAVFNGFIYVATQDYGIKRADITNPNLIDANQWTTVTTGSWAGIETFGTELVAVTSAGQLNRYNGSAFVGFNTLPAAPKDLRATSDYLIAVTAGKVSIFNQTLGLATQVFNYSITDVAVQFTCATVIGQNIYIGTLAHGVFVTTLANPTVFENITPDGPAKNNVFSLNTQTPDLWVTYGDYTYFYDPDPLLYEGISKFNAEGWNNIPYADVHPTGKDVNDLVRMTFNPNNPSQFYVSSYHSGLLKFENEEFVQLYDQTNSELESLVLGSVPSYISIRVEQSAFDSNGNLWMTNAKVEDGLKVLRANGTWESVDMSPIIDDFFSDSFGRLVVDKNDTKWMVTYANGVVAYNENAAEPYKKITVGSETGNLPINDARAIAIDKRNQLWIGTRKGLRVLSSVDRFNNEGQMRANEIVIETDDGDSELLYEQAINDICVDGANNKWIGTVDSGVFMFSSDGQEEIHHFTTTNSPLPSNAINDIEINGTTGEVYIATDKGLVSFKGVNTDPKDNLSSVYVYPNPVRPGFTGTVKIANLIDNANVKIADIAGNLVFEKVSEGGTVEWDTTAFGKYRVASGVYMIFIASDDGTETKVKKVMIVR